MDASERRETIVRLLHAAETPLTGAHLATRLGVTRQVVVQDVAVLRASGVNILATPRGYALLAEAKVTGVTKLIAVRHHRDETAEELYAAVDLGIEVIDVVVDHPVYGQLTGQLSLRTRSDVDQFLRRMDNTGAGLLSSLTDGVHLHTVRGKTRACIDSLERILEKKGFLLIE